MNMTIQFLAGFLAAILISLLAYWSRSLSRSGAFSAVIIGSLIFGFGGWRWALILLAFFISSSLLTRLFQRRKAEVTEKFAKGGQRDAGQVLANGAIPAVLAMVNLFFPTASWTWWVFAASVAAVNADTWATELGVLNPTPPRLITSGKPVEKGSSGAISPFGLLAALGGAGLIALLSVLLEPAPSSETSAWFAFTAVCLAGLLGALFDSLLGATVQGIYFCPQCKKETERHPVHLCGASTSLRRGWKWLDNDAVNTACSACGAILCLFFYLIVQGLSR